MNPELALMCARCGHVLLIADTWNALVYQRCPECDGPMGPMEDVLRNKAAELAARP